MYKIFLDTNIVFSYFYAKKENKKNVATLLFNFLRKHNYKILISDLVKEELCRNADKIKIPENELNKEIKNFIIKPDIEIADNILFKINPLLLDLSKNDKIILTTAIFYKANIFITGNRKDFEKLYGRKILNTYIFSLKESIKFILKSYKC